MTTKTRSRIVLVGELNPYGSDLRYALFDEPRNSAGSRLRRMVLGLSRRTYFGPGFTRVNLCSGKWSAPTSRDAAADLLTEHGDEAVFVLLGRKVAAAFLYGGHSAFTRHEDCRGRETVLLPHPSGLCRTWSEPGAFERARSVLRESAPWIPWGELSDPERGGER